MMKSFKKITCGALALTFALSMSACNLGDSATDETAYMTMDINPTVEFIIKDGKISEVKAGNEDGAVLIVGETFEGLTVEEAAKKVTELAEDLGYLTDSNKDVKVNVIADKDSVVAEIEAEAREGVEDGSLKAIINFNPRSKDNREGARHGIDGKKVRLIESIMEYDPDMTYEIGATMSVEDLLDLLDDYADRFECEFGDEIEDQIEQAIDEIEAGFEQQIAHISGYEDIFTRYHAVRKVYMNLEAKAKAITVSETDMNTILESLGMKEEHKDFFKGKDGHIRPDDVDDFLDKYFDDDDDDDDGIEHHIPGYQKPTEQEMEDFEDVLDDMLDAYDEDEYVLTAEDYQALATAWGEVDATEVDVPAFPTAEELETLEDVEGFLEDVEDIMEDKAKNNAGLMMSAAKEMIENVKNQMKRAFETVKVTLQTQINQAKQQLLDKKEQLKQEVLDALTSESTDSSTETSDVVSE